MSLRAYVAPIPATLSRGIHRVAEALARYAPPDVEIVADLPDADLVLCHVIGPEGWPDYLSAFRRHGQRYAVFQYCLRTTTWPYVAPWRDFWREAAVVASYYDLATTWRVEQPGWTSRPNFLRTPLGVDTTVFKPHPQVAGIITPYLVGTSGYVAGPECVWEWAEVCRRHHKAQFHLGPHLPELSPHARTAHGIDDGALAVYLSACKFVSGLRRGEGFELPAYEGLACGARPVMFAREDAEHWLGDSAEYIQEGSFDDVVAQLEALVQREYRPVTADEIAWVGREFSWQRMAERFWSAVPR